MPLTELPADFRTFRNGRPPFPVKFVRVPEKSAPALSFHHQAAAVKITNISKNQQFSTPSSLPWGQLTFPGASQQPLSSGSLPRGQPAFPGASQQSPRGQPAVSQSTSLKWNYTHTFGSCKYVSMYF